MSRLHALCYKLVSFLILIIISDGPVSDILHVTKPKVWAGPPNECRTSAECCVLGFNDVFYW